MNNKEQKRKYWQEHFNTYLKSGLSQREYCRQNELGYCTFNTWKRSFEKLESGISLQKLPFEISGKDSSFINQMEIILPGNIKLSVPNNFSSETLKRIIIALGELK